MAWHDMHSSRPELSVPTCHQMPCTVNVASSGPAGMPGMRAGGGQQALWLPARECLAHQAYPAATTLPICPPAPAHGLSHRLLLAGYMHAPGWPASRGLLAV